MKLFRVPRTKAWARANISFREDTNRGGGRELIFRFVKTRTEAEHFVS